MRRIVVAGASRGIGAEIARRLVAEGDDIICLSRSPAPHGMWVQCDLSNSQSIATAKDQIGTKALNALIYAGGVWEDGAFTSDYDFSKSPVDETLNVLAVNLTGAILLTQNLQPVLRQANPGRVLFVGSLSGLDNAASPEVANSASKYGLRGAAQALEKSLRADRIGVTVLNPGNVETPEVLDDIKSGAFSNQDPIPFDDLVACVALALNLSPASTIREINLAQMRP